jgi:hypothetical protein
MGEDPRRTHITYLESEVMKIGARADRLEAMIPDIESEQKKRAFRELVGRLREEVREHCKYLALIKQP